MRITPLGDSALRIEVAKEIGEAALARVQVVCAALETSRVPGVSELVPAYTTVTVHYDPAAAVGAGAPRSGVVEWMTERVVAALQRLPSRPAQKVRRVEIPVCYGGAFGPDLERVATQARLPVTEVVRRHVGGDYLVHLIGFSPGFPYLGGMAPELATPRLAQPRARVPAGSVAIAGGQTGVYPLATPGGWNLIGRTPLRLFRPDEDPPVLLQAGDRVRFRAITMEEFAQAEAAR